MRLEVAAAGRPRTVEVRRTSGHNSGSNSGSQASAGDVVVLDGRERPVSVARAGRAWSLIVDRRSYAVSVVEHRRGEFTVHVNGRAVPVVVAGRAVRLKPDATVGAALQRIVAPMPGRIVKLLVKVGDVVVARQGLVVVEAMKMENELRAPRAGTITEVKVAEGASVDAQAVLVVLE